MRILWAILSSIFISTGLFFGMQLMISSDDINVDKTKDTPRLVYLREKRDTNIERKKRVKPKEPPKEKIIKKIKILKTDITPKVDPNVKVKPFKAITKNIDISAISSLSGAQISISGNLIDARTLQTLRKVNPRYPRKAKVRRKEGYVELQFHIDKNGNVSNVKVIKATPKGFFERSAIKALKRWKFKPTGSASDAIIPIYFRLAS